jgi:hypothetical protein
LLVEEEKGHEDKNDPEKMLRETQRKKEAIPLLFTEEKIQEVAEKKGGSFLFQRLFGL